MLDRFRAPMAESSVHQTRAANYHVVAPIVLGYPKAWPESHGRNPAEIHWLGETQEEL